MWTSGPVRALCAAPFVLAVCCNGDEPADEALLPPVEQPLQYVVPAIGTGGFGYHFGSAFAGAAAPHGLVKVGPDTRGPYGTINFLHYSGYWYGDDTVQGFSHLHLHGTGATDYGVLSLMPSDGFDEGRRTRDGYGSRFAKGSEVLAPGRYEVTLDRGSIRAAITATVHAAHHRYTFGKGTQRHVILDLDHHLEGGTVRDADLKLDPGRGLITGRLRSLGGMSNGYGGYDVFFAIRSRTSWTAAQVWRSGAPAAPGDQVSGTGVGADLDFGVGEEPIELQVGVSLVDVESAAANLAQEMPGWDWAAAAAATAKEWHTLLSTFRVTGGSEEERRIFYSALYHAFLMPTIHSDADGRYRGHDGVVRRADGFRFVSDLSLWDTYRTLNPLYAMAFPAHARDVARSLLEMARQRGAFPKWPLAGGDSGSMVGAGADIVLADTYLRGVQDFDVGAAYDLARAAALALPAPVGGRGGREGDDYLKLAYVPSSRNGSVSVTTELARDDFALGQLALALGKTQDAATLLKRAEGWRALFDPAWGFLRARTAEGAWADASAPDPLCFCKPYIEANAWQSLWMPSYDLTSGLAALVGGEGALVRKLEAFFEGARVDYEENDPQAILTNAQPRPYYWAGNQPDIHAGYLFALLGRPDLTQRWVRWAMTTHYGAGPDGLPGNDDGGTMSAWYLFSAMGLYPQVGSDGYVIGVPLFPRVEMAIGGGVFTMEAPRVSAARYYVQEATLNGAPLSSPVLRQKDLQPGSVLRFVVSETPGPWARR